MGRTGTPTTFKQQWQLATQLAQREIKARYKQSVLGYAWVMLNPLFQMLVMAFVFSFLMRFPGIGVPYPLYLYVGLLPWTLLANSLTSGMNSLIENRSLIAQIYFPRELLVLATMLAKLVDFLLASTVLILFFMYFQIPFTWNALWVIPILLIQMMFMFGTSLLLASFNLFYRDVQYLFTLVLTLWMYLTPVIYPVEALPEKYRFLFQLNPMAVLINAYRQVLLNGQSPSFDSLTVALGLSLVIVAIGFAVFKKLEGMFSDVI